MIPDVRADTQVDAFAFTGGLDLVSPSLTIPNGRLIQCQNYEPDINGGYRRAGAYERFDGRTRPSDGTYYALACTTTATINSGDLVEVGAASGRYVGAVADGILLAQPTGTWAGSTSMTVSAAPVGTTAADPRSSYGGAIADNAQALADVADYLRTSIAAPAGSGAIRGVFSFGGSTYCFRDNAGGTAAVMFKATTSGWVAVTQCHYIAFTAGGTGEIAVGETVKGATSAATGVVQRVFLESGSWASSDAAGRIFIDTVTGTFQAAENLQSSVDAYVATRGVCSGAQTSVTFNDGGKLRSTPANFAGSSGTLAQYGVDGVNEPWEFDGTYVYPIVTGVAGVFPSQVVAHRGYLYLAYGSSLLYSVPGEPWRYVASEGAGEIAVGDDMTDLVVLPGESIGIFTRNKSQALVGADDTVWALQAIAADSGAVAHTVQSLNQTYALDDRGVVNVQASQNYGNFEFSTVSRLIQPLINEIRNVAVDTCVVRTRNVYRIFCSNGTVISMLAGQDGVQFGELYLGVVPNVVWSGEDSTGTERIFIGATDGMVYEMDVGTSQDGDPVEAFLRTSYYSLQSPRVRKRFRKLALDMQVDGYAVFSVSAELSYGSTDIALTSTETITAGGAGGQWGASNWDEFFWDGQDVQQPEISLTGTGLNLAISVYSNTVLDSGHVLQAAIIHFTPRRLQR